VHWCVYRNVDEGCGCFLEIVIIIVVVDGLVFAVRCTARRKLWRQWSLSIRQRRDAPSRRNVRQQMHSFRSVECLSMLLRSCVIVIKWDDGRFMAISMRLLGLHLLRMLNTNSLFEFIMPSQTTCWPSRSGVSLRRSSHELYKAFEDFSFHRVLKLSKTQAS